MAHSQIVCTYNATAYGQTAAALAAVLAAVPLDLGLPGALGLAPSADVTSEPTSTTVQRQITLLMGGASSFSGVPIVVSGGAPAGSIEKITVPAGVATNYPAIPVVSIDDPTGSGASAVCTGCGIGSVLLVNGGSGYTSAPSVSIVGGNQTDSGTPAVLVAHVSGGVVTAVTISGAGSGYTEFVELEFTGGGGSGAVAYGVLVPQTIVVTAGGEGYTAPTVVITPLFTSGNPDSTDQAGTVIGWMKNIFAAACATPFTEATPVVS